MKKIKNLRHWYQAAFFALTNGYAKGFLEGKIYTGPTKMVCAPGLNCYSCPGALMACPIGSLQSILSGKQYQLSLYVFGILMAFGTFFGRFICGWMCPFGLFQDLLHKIPVFKKKKSLPGHKYLKYLKYLVLVLPVIILPFALRDDLGLGTTLFCKNVCPSGTLLAGIPLLSLNGTLRTAIGALFARKFIILVVIALLAVKFYRPFCKYLCPLGAFYGFFNPFSMSRMIIDEGKCVKCGACTRTCKMDIDVMKNPNSFECIRCGDCKSVCGTGAILSLKDIVAQGKNITDVSAFKGEQ